MTSPASSTSTRPSNLRDLDYAAEAATFARLPYPIIDVHSHINGLRATPVYRQAAELYGVGMTYSMTKLEEVEPITELMEGRIRFIAVPNYWTGDRKHNLGPGFLDRIRAYHTLGSRICKFWAAPRSRDYGREFGDPDYMRLDAPHRIDAMRLATDLGMLIMVHVADPDTWFRTKYADASFYGTKRSHYEPLERLLDQFTQPWIAAHFGGWPEDLDFLAALLDRHPNLHLDTSATKWIVREIGRHPRDEVVDFLRRFTGRVMFGSDIVSADEHFDRSTDRTEMSAKASSPDEAFDLYASRYWALRRLWESDGHEPSPIADPDLHMVDPDAHGPLDAPTLVGKALPADLVRSLYHDAAERLLEPLHAS